MQKINLTKANVQDGIRLVKTDAEGFNKESSIEDIIGTRIVAIIKVRMRNTGDLRDLMVFGTVGEMVEYPVKPEVVFNVKTYHGLAEALGTESVAKITDAFYREVQEKLAE